MAKKNKPDCRPDLTEMGAGGCKVESVITVDERGQLVLPKEVREKANIRAGDKLAVITWERDGRVCCILLMKEQELAATVKGILGPMMKGIL